VKHVLHPRFVCQHLCRVVSSGGVVTFCRLVFTGKFCKYVTLV
jgi:hypothetical protein